jgi:hypothetical protein
MNYAVLTVPDFALHALRRSDPSLCGRPFALVAGEGRKARVTAASPEALRRRARARGDARDVALPRDHPAAARPRRGGGGPPAPGRRGLHALPARRVHGLRLLHGRPAGRRRARTEALMRLRAAELAGAGLPLRIGAGATPLLASYAARCAEPVLSSATRRGLPGAAAARLRGADPEQEDILRGLGDRDPGGADRPPQGRGRPPDGRGGCRSSGSGPRRGDPRPAPCRAREELRGGVGLRAAGRVDRAPALQAAAVRRAVALELRGAGFVAERLSLTLLLEDETDHRREFRLPEPGADVDGWLRVLNSHLEGVRHGRPRRRGAARRLAGAARRRSRTACSTRGCATPPRSGRTSRASPRSSATTGWGRPPAPTRTARTRSGWRGRPSPWRRRSGRPFHPAYGPTLRRFRPPWPVRVACDGAGRRGSRGGAGGGGPRRARALGLLRATGGSPARGPPRPGRSSLPRGALPAGAHGGRLVRRGDAGLGPPCRTSNSTRAARSRSCAPARCPSPWPPRPRASRCRPSRSATATASTARCGCTCRGRRRASGRWSAAELTMEDGSVVPVLVATRAGYQGLCRLLTTAHLRAEKGEGRVAGRSSPARPRG